MVALELSFVTYALLAYVLLPTVGILYNNCKVVINGYKELSRSINGVINGYMELIEKCSQEEKCVEWLQRMEERLENVERIGKCLDPQSNARKRAADRFSHVQHPQDPQYCLYQLFDQIESNTALESLKLLESVEIRFPLPPSEFSDECAAPSSQDIVLTFETIEAVLPGKWNKLYTTGWDLWPCQQTEFLPPLFSSSKVPPEPWMTEWPNSPHVFRMDLWWKNSPEGALSFHMRSNEMYPHESWNFDDVQLQQSHPTPTIDATLKTKVVKWSLETHENWYLLDFDETTQTMLIYYCAFTPAVKRFDSIAMVLQKEGNPQITEQQAFAIQQKAFNLLGEKHSRLQKIEDCK